ncbi:hypothetical protein DM01DRAFT_1170179 [Hesseltinella vesiculosa]|uniref:Uncharacterized protein n=1 Tax=Hesseltinella vesiculosa TaxID=101127 RepID=A0A1X2G5P5_9FUNG|nr:hypothetical protein DM01DRAFT_1170179 [Hesseltinella vesiculosa]
MLSCSISLCKKGIACPSPQLQCLSSGGHRTWVCKSKYLTIVPTRTNPCQPVPTHTISY